MKVLKCPGFSEHYVIEKQPGLLQTELQTFQWRK